MCVRSAVAVSRDSNFVVHWFQEWMPPVGFLMFHFCIMFFPCVLLSFSCDERFLGCWCYGLTTIFNRYKVLRILGLCHVWIFESPFRITVSLLIGTFLASVGPLWFCIGCSAYHINKFFPLVVYNWGKVSAPMTERNPRTTQPPHKINYENSRRNFGYVGHHWSNATPHSNPHSVRWRAH
jgi:hypothetical protein